MSSYREKGSRSYSDASRGFHKFSGKGREGNIQKDRGLFEDLHAAGQISGRPGIPVHLPLGSLLPASGAGTGAPQLQQQNPFVIRVPFSQLTPDGNNDIIIYNGNSPSLRFLSVEMHFDPINGAPLLATLRDAPSAGGNALTNALDCNLGRIERATELNHPGAPFDVVPTVPPGTSLYLNFDAPPAAPLRGELLIQAVKL